MQNAKYLQDIVKYYDQVLDNTGLYLAIIDIQGNILYTNQAVRRLIGLEKNFIEGNQISHFLTSEFTSKILKRITEVVLSQKSQNFETSLSGNYFIVNLHPLNYESGEMMAVQVISQDITSIKTNQLKLAASEQMFRDLSENVPAVVYQWYEKHNGEFGFKFVSPKLKEYFDFDTSDMNKVHEFIHPEDKERWRHSIEESKKNKTPWTFEGRFLYPDGKIIWWLGKSVISEVTDEAIIYNGTMTDITHRKEAEIKLKDQLDTLRSLAYHNSHTVRRHTANILGLCHLFEEENELNSDNARVISLIKEESINLDKMIIGIANLITKQEKQ